jgi:pyruvate kinase
MMPKTKIICTLGPASSERSVLLKMMRSGMDVVRLNFSHGSLKEHLEKIRAVRALNKKYRRHIKILGDLEGYRIRVGTFKGGKPIEVKKRETVWLTPEDVQGKESLIPFDYKGPLSDIKKGQYIYIDDGNIALVVESREKNRLKAKVAIGGSIKERKGINMPDLELDIKGLTQKDIEHIGFCVENKVDYIAQSFVRSKEDIMALREELEGRSYKCAVIAKIENRQGIKNIDDIISVYGHIASNIRGPHIAEENNKKMQSREEIRHYRYPDAREHDTEPHTYKGRGLRRGKRHTGRDGLRDAFRRDGRWGISGRNRGYDE